MRAYHNAIAVCGAGLAVVCCVSVSPVRAAPTAVSIRGVVDKALRSELRDALSSFPSPASSRLEARRRADEAGDKVIAVLRSEGYYDSVVNPDIADGDAPEAFVTVDPGSRSKIADPTVEWIGPAPDPAATTAAIGSMTLKPGDPGRAEAVIDAESRIVATLRQHGYADAEARPREVIVDHADQTVRPAFRIAAGALVKLDGVILTGTSRTRPSWVRSLAPWKPGQVYRPDDLAQLELRLRDTGAFDAVSVALAPASRAVDGLRPVMVALVDRPKATLELGGSYSTTEGAGVDSRWIVYNRFKRADILTTSLQVAQIESRLQTELSLPDWRKAGQTLKLTLAGYSDVTTAYDSRGGVISADATHRLGKISFVTFGLSLDGSSTDEKEAANYVRSNRSRTLVIPALLAEISVDKSNDPLDPTRGWRWQARAEPTYAFGDGSIGYLKASAQASGYLPVGDWGTVLAARAKVGTILGGDIPLVPAPARFYAGGGGSVRGYAYQAVGPRYGDNTPSGGLSLFETSFELRQPIVGPWSAVAFLDAGAVGLRVNPDFSHPDLGAGVGVRYNLGFGPIRVDVATPLQQRHGDAPVQLYLSIGQAF